MNLGNGKCRRYQECTIAKGEVMHGEQFKQMTVALAIGGGKMDYATVTLARVTSIFSRTLIPYLMS